MLSDAMPAATPTDKTAPPAPTMRRICCVVAAQRPAPSFADQLRAAAVWAQIFQGAEAAREQAQIAEPPVE
ncbi:MAG: hypothetical protein WCI67_17535 [Chloroflexales bacterium]